ncbi:MAG: FtsW/RodA/SpoVE family cell cycle protein, partial [Lachnospiraceae bacterium]|nr:FtsW/RodA/SpoVE family cell cycle protein [Lachnospiraceae bacterium]
MVQYITTLSKYFIAIVMLLYTLGCFLVFRYKDEHARKSIYVSQLIMIVLVHFACFLSIILKTGDVSYLIFYAALQIFILGVIEIIPMIYPRSNRLLINNACMLISIGLIMLVRLNFNSAVKQFIIAAVSFVICGFIPFAMQKLKKIPNIPYVYAGIGILALALVFFLGSISGGSRLSVKLFGMYFMPSEFVKVLFVLFVAGALCIDSSFKNLIITTAIAAVHVIILAGSNDLGAALIYYVVFVVLVFIATQNYIYLSIGTLTGVGIAIAAYNIFRHVRVRIAAFVDPFSVIDNEGYQITQSLFALSSGSWFGVGFFNGTPDSIPYVETDFIFSAIVQELGIVFAICMILIR